MAVQFAVDSSDKLFELEYHALDAWLSERVVVLRAHPLAKFRSKRAHTTAAAASSDTE